MNSAYIILDRDGVISYDSDDYIKSVEEPNSIEVIVQLSKAGFIILTATNQSGLARGYFSDITLANMHTLMYGLVEARGGKILSVFFCPQLASDQCTCRKPLPSLLDQMEVELSISLGGAWFVGAIEKDIEVVLSKNCKPILVRTGKGALTYSKLSPEKLDKNLVFDDLVAASQYILSQTNKTQEKGLH